MVKFNQNPFFNTIHIRTNQMTKFYHISTKTGLFKVGQHAPPFYTHRQLERSWDGRRRVLIEPGCCNWRMVLRNRPPWRYVRCVLTRRYLRRKWTGDFMAIIIDGEWSKTRRGRNLLIWNHTLSEGMRNNILILWVRGFKFCFAEWTTVNPSHL